MLLFLHRNEFSPTIFDMKPSTIFKNADYPAPDGSEIRLLSNIKNGGACHCTLPPQQVSKAMKHQTVEEIWYFLEGEGEVWRKYNELESIEKVSPGMSLSILLECHFQFRNTGNSDLKFVIFDTPPWPGETEAIPVEGKW